MIIVRLKGGLGNQFFQYAFGRAVATYRNDKLYFDLNFLNTNHRGVTPREFKLQALNNYHVADQLTLNRLNALGQTGKAVFIADGYPKDAIMQIIGDKNIAAILLDGYFQDEFYFLNSSKLIRKELNALLDYYYNSLKIIHGLINKGQQSVSIHLRRGDYLNPGTLKVHGICELPYYKEAVRIILSKLSDPKFYIFSDDPQHADWLFSTLPEDKINVSAIINNTEFLDKDLLELSLMSKCENFIMANSSFSWWGSYLSEASPKLVIGPKKWYADETMHQLSEDISLESWIRI